MQDWTLRTQSSLKCDVSPPVRTVTNVSQCLWQAAQEQKGGESCDREGEKGRRGAELVAGLAAVSYFFSRPRKLNMGIIAAAPT